MLVDWRLEACIRKQPFPVDANCWFDHSMWTVSLYSVPIRSPQRSPICIVELGSNQPVEFNVFIRSKVSRTVPRLKSTSGSVTASASSFDVSLVNCSNVLRLLRLLG